MRISLFLFKYVQLNKYNKKNIKNWTKDKILNLKIMQHFFTRKIYFWVFRNSFNIFLLLPSSNKNKCVHINNLLSFYSYSLDYTYIKLMFLSFKYNKYLIQIFDSLLLLIKKKKYFEKYFQFYKIIISIYHLIYLM